MSFNAPLPKDTPTVLEGHIKKVSNLGLLFNKYIFSWPNDWKIKEGKKEFLDKIYNTFNQTYLKEELAAIQARQEKLCNSFKESGWFVKQFKLKTQTRLILGLGGTNVLETGMTLHPLYGFPYIPASGLKGLARAYAEISEALSPEEVRSIFGSEDKDPKKAAYNRQGKVIFLDGLPNKFPKLDLDVMNPHYSEYYQGEKDSGGNLIPPADYLNPVPIFFIAVAPGETFSFAIFSREEECAKKAEELLINGLTELGAGGKTNVGYGYFQKPSATQSAVNEQKTEEIRQTGLHVTEAQKHQITPQEPVQEKWDNATLTWSPGNKTLIATWQNKKAERKIDDDRSIVPESLRSKLFEKRKSAQVTITVEPIGNAFRIVAFAEQ